MPIALLGGAALAAGALAAWGVVWLHRLISVATAYKAKVLASLVFGTDRTIDPERAVEVSADSYWPLRLFRTEIDRDARAVTVSFFGLRARTAVFRPGRMASPAFPCTSAAWLRGPASSALDRVVDLAFTEPDPRRLRRTRAVVVVYDGRIVAERYAPGFSETTRCAGWSMTKSVLSALVGILAGEGKLALTDTELFAAWRGPDPRARISLEDLLRMRSGLRFTEVYDSFSSDVNEMLFKQTDAAAYAARQPLVAAPGSAWNYSSGTTNMLSAIVRRVVGEQAYPDFPRTALFDPLGMSSAVMEADGSGTFVASSFMLATARDWARFGQLYVQDGVWDGTRMLPEGWVRFSTTPTPQSDGMYGAHWWLKLKPEIGGGTAAASRIRPDAFFAVGHEGQTLTIIPSLRLVVVRLGTSIYIDAWNQAAFIAGIQDALRT